VITKVLYNHDEGRVTDVAQKFPLKACRLNALKFHFRAPTRRSKAYQSDTFFCSSVFYLSYEELWVAESCTDYESMFRTVALRIVGVYSLTYRLCQNASYGILPEHLVALAATGAPLYIGTEDRCNDQSHLGSNGSITSLIPWHLSVSVREREKSMLLRYKSRNCLVHRRGALLLPLLVTRASRQKSRSIFTKFGDRFKRSQRPATSFM